MKSKDLRWRVTARRSALFVALMQVMVVYAQDGVSTSPPTDPGNAAGGVGQQKTTPAAKRTKASSVKATQLGAVIVTAEKREENIQKVPIAITAFSGEDLNDRKIETGGDLVTATPNVTFTKTNFASYNFQIRGIGTQALSVTTDPAVAVSFNDTPLIRNRLFEQEYFDVNNVEVLRGPQGTLYGRNATGGVVNMIPNLADPAGFDSWGKVETGNYTSKRFSGMVNLPLSDTAAFRLAGAWTDRDGYTQNTVTNKGVDGRKLWSARGSFVWKPNDRFDANLIWEHFNENDSRARTGKQLCHNDPGPVSVGGVTVGPGDRSFLSQGCADGRLYGSNAYGVPNGSSLPVVLASQYGFSAVYGYDPSNPISGGTLSPQGLDPYAGIVQSRDLRKIATSYDPIFRAKNDVVQLNLNGKVSDDLKLVSQSLYTRDRYYSSQDYGRFQSNPFFSNSDTWKQAGGGVNQGYPELPGGVYTDPQLGPSNRFLQVDLVQSHSKQWSQEFRLQSSYDGPFNFSLGANYLDYKVDESYYVVNNVFSALAQGFFSPFFGDGTACPAGQVYTGDFMKDIMGCVYVDPNKLNHINGDGHNYYRSRNVAETRSKAIFGETYWRFADTWKLTTGLRYTYDEKTTTPYPTQLLVSPSALRGAGYINSGLRSLPDIKQHWGEFTGRVVLDWTPQLSFTDSTMFYGSYSRGYKAGGTNSPGIDANPAFLVLPQHDPRFQPEFVNAFELGTKNVLGNGKFTFNADVFYYDYTGYQVSQIIDRQTLNENFNAKIMGAEFELGWKPSREFQLNANLGLLKTRIDNHQYSLDVMNRTQGNPDWVLIRGNLLTPSNCVAPKALVEQLLNLARTDTTGMFANGQAANVLTGFCPGQTVLGGGGFSEGQWGGMPAYNPLTDAPNQGAGFKANVGGHSLPNAPHFTVSLSPQYTFFLPRGDGLTVRADLYHQGASWARVYQDKIDRLHGWSNINLSLTYNHAASDLTVQLYVKNALDGTAITGTFLNSDDTGLSANVFTQDPRIIGLSLRKGFF